VAFFQMLSKLCEVLLGVLAVGSLVLWKINDQKKPYADISFWDSISTTFFTILALRWVSIMVVGPEQDRVSSGRWLVFFIVINWLPNLVVSLRRDRAKAKVQG
jgi:hypothetical protein